MNDGIGSDEYISISRTLDRVEKLLNRIDKDLSEDRKDIDLLRVRLGKIEELQERNLDISDRQTRKLKETVEDAVEKQIEPMAEQVSQIQEIINGGD